MGLSTPNPQVVSGRVWRGLGVAALALGLLAACGGGGGGGGGTSTDGPAATSLTPSTTAPLRGAAFHLTPVYSNGTGAITYPGGTVACPATGQASSDITANWSGAREYTLTVTSSTNATATKTATVTPQTVVVGAISPAAPAIQPGVGPTSFSASVSGGATGNVTWSVAVGTNANAGTIDASTGSYTSPATTGTVIVTATSVDDPTKSNSTTVTIAIVSSGSLAASTTTPLHGATNVTIIPNFVDAASVLVGTTQGGSDLAVNPTSGQAIPVQADGFTATWTYWMRMTDLFSNQSDWSVTITPQTVSLTAVSPATPTIAGGGSQTFSGATVSGGYLGTRTWSVAAGTNASAGSINASTGVYTAPTTGGTVIITATSNDDNTKSVNTTATVVAGPAITSFKILQDTFTSGSTNASALAVFSGGTGLVTGGGIAAGGLSITSGSPVTITPAPTATSTYTLTVHNTTLNTDDTKTAKALVGSLSILAGVPSGLGNIDGVIASGTGTKARFWMPSGMVADGSGGFYVSDYENNCIRHIDSTGTVTTPYGSLSGQHGNNYGESPSGNAARFYGPAGLALGGGYLYVVDAWNQAIRKINTTTGAVITLAGSPDSDGISKGAAGLADGTSDGTTTAGSSRFHFISDGSGSTPSMVPPSLALNGTTLYVADQINHCIRRVDTGTGAVTTGANGSEFGTPGTAGAVDTATLVTYHYPSGLLFDSTSGNKLYVADYGSNAVRVIDLDGSTVSTLASSLAGPVGLALNSGILYESDYDGSAIYTIPLTPGTATLLAGATGVTGSTDADGAAARFHTPSALVVSGTNLYVADTGNNTLRTVTIASPYTVGTYAGVAGNPDYSDSGIGLFNGPTGVAYDNGVVYVADTSNRAVRAITLGGAVTTPIRASVGTTPSTFVPSAIAVSSSHTVYVGNDTDKAIYTINGASLAAVAVSGATFQTISGLAVDTAGNIYVADCNGSAVYKITSGVATALGSGYSYPVGLALNPDGSLLYVADGSDHLIYAQPTAGGTKTVLAGTGAVGLVDGAAGVAQFGAVAGLTIDAEGNLYVADTNNNAVRKVTPAGYVTTVCGVSGTMANIATTGGPFALPASLAHPLAVAVVPTLDSGSDKMFIALGDGILSIGF